MILTALSIIILTQAAPPAGSGGGGVSAMTAVGSTPNANGATISGSNLTLQPADATHPGDLTSGAQTIGGAKTFPDGVTVGASGVTFNDASAQTKAGITLATTAAANRVALCNDSSCNLNTSTNITFSSNHLLIGAPTDDTSSLLQVNGDISLDGANHKLIWNFAQNRYMFYDGSQLNITNLGQLNVNDTGNFYGNLIAAHGSVEAMGTGGANNITINGSAAAAPVTIAATGSDTNISVDLITKGSGSLNVKQGATQIASFGAGGITFPDSTVQATAATGGGGTVSGLTTNRIPHAASATTLADDSNNVWDPTNHRMGIGTASPGQRLDVTSETGGGVALQLRAGDTTSYGAIKFNNATTQTMGMGTGDSGGAAGFTGPYISLGQDLALINNASSQVGKFDHGNFRLSVEGGLDKYTTGELDIGPSVATSVVITPATTISGDLTLSKTNQALVLTNGYAEVHTGVVNHGYMQFDSASNVADTNYSAASSYPYEIVYTSISAARTVALPTNIAGIEIIVRDASGSCSALNTITISTVQGGSVVLNSAFGFARFRSDATKWYRVG